MTTRTIGYLGLLLVGMLSAWAEKPNLLIIYTDDQGYGDISVYGKKDIRTPHMDRIADEGMLFTQMRANCTVCSPSRAALLTGIYADRAGVPGVVRTHAENSWGYMDPAVPTIADELGKAGYHTALVGKWHLGLEAPNTPNGRGFDFFHGFLGDMMDDYYKGTRHGNNYLRRNGEVVEPTKHATDMFTDWAVSYFADRSQKKEEPFFLFLAYNAPHFPIQPPDEWLERVKQREPQMDAKRARAVAFVEHLDAAVGRVLESLDELGLAKNTVVVFTSDNGGSLAHHQNCDPWRGGKQDHYDGGLKVPFMLRWPGQVEEGSTSDYQGLTFDIFPTFLELAGAKPRKDLDAVSLKPILKGGKIDAPRELYFVRREGGPRGGKAYHAIIKDGWKLMQNSPFSPLELYHLEKDPYETTDLASKNPGKKRALLNRLRHHIQRGGATPWQQPSQ